MNEFARAAVEPMLRLTQETGKPLITSSFYDRRDNVVRALQDHRVPVFDIPERAVSALAALVRYGEIRRRIEAAAGDPPRS
jgi:acyl-CoA synthetase (NDP forming)